MPAVPILPGASWQWVSVDPGESATSRMKNTLRGFLSMFSTLYRAVGGLAGRIDEILLSLMPCSLTFTYTPGPNSVRVPL
jgi:hypothetical protein